MHLVKRLAATRAKPEAKIVERPFPKKNWSEVQSAPSIWDFNYLVELPFMNSKPKNPNEAVSALVKQSNKRITSNLANYE